MCLTLVTHPFLQDIRISRSHSDVGQSRSILVHGDQNQQVPAYRQRSRDSQGSDSSGGGGGGGGGQRHQEFDSRIFRRHVDKQVTFQDEKRDSYQNQQQGSRPHHGFNQPYQRPNNAGRGQRKSWENNDENQFPQEIRNNPLLRSKSFGFHENQGGQNQGRRQDNHWDQHDRRGRNNYQDNHGNNGRNHGNNENHRGNGNNFNGNQRGEYQNQNQRNGFGRGNRNNDRNYDRRDNYRDIRPQYQKEDWDEEVGGPNQGHGGGWNREKQAPAYQRGFSQEENRGNVSGEPWFWSILNDILFFNPKCFVLN